MPLIILGLASVVALLWYLTRSTATVSSAAPSAPGPSPSPQGPPAPESITYTKPEIVNLIREVCIEEGYNGVPLIRAIVSVESGYNPRAINRNDRPPSVGLMGIKVPTARYYVPFIEIEEQLFDAPTNLRAGIRFVKDLENKWLASYGLDGVIQMYNLGETRFLRGERSPDYLGRVRAIIGQLIGAPSP
jgi:soluble lytic murein transglycosylase-like protein